MNSFYTWSRVQNNNPSYEAPYGFPYGQGTTGQNSAIQYGPAPGASSFPIGPYNRTSFTQGQYTYNRGPQRNSGPVAVSSSPENTINVGQRILHEVYRTFPQPFSQQTQVSGHNGGAGGAGGLGRGFNNQPGGCLLYTSDAADE